MLDLNLILFQFNLIQNYKSKNKESIQNIIDRHNEESKIEKEDFFDLIVDSICNDSSEVQARCEEIMTSITNMITNKNEEIQNAKENLNKEKRNIDLNIKELNSLKNEAEESLKAINQRIEAIDKDIEGNN